MWEAILKWLASGGGKELLGNASRSKAATQLGGGLSKSTQLVSSGEQQKEANGGAKNAVSFDWEKLAGMAGKVGGAPRNVLSKDSPFAATGALLRTGEDLPVVGKLAKFGAAVTESVDDIRQWGDHLHQANMRFADVSAAMAAVQASSENAAIWLTMEQGQRRASTAKELSEAQNRMNRASAPFEDAWANFQNKVGARLLETLSDVLESFSDLIKKVDATAESMGAVGNFFNPMAGLRNVDRLVSSDENDAESRRPARMR